MTEVQQSHLHLRYVFRFSHIIPVFMTHHARINMDIGINRSDLTNFTRNTVEVDANRNDLALASMAIILQVTCQRFYPS